MPYLNPESQKAAQAKWYQNAAKVRRKEWLAQNGPCRKCGSSKRLEVDHIDPMTKVSHRIWTWTEERRNVELAKCQVLCRRCHTHKSLTENIAMGRTIIGLNAKKTECKHGHPFDLFNTIIRSDGTRECRACRRNRRRNQEQPYNPSSPVKRISAIKSVDSLRCQTCRYIICDCPRAA